MFKYFDLLKEIDEFERRGVEVGSIGNSTLGFDTPYIFIGDKSKNCIVVTGAIHAREHITALLVVNQAKHLLKNALAPIITRASTVLPFLFTGSLLLESFFGIPGLGYEGINALNDSDLQMLKALVITGAFLFVAINLLTDISYAWADPRMRLNKNNK